VRSGSSKKKEERVPEKGSGFSLDGGYLFLWKKKKRGRRETSNTKTKKKERAAGGERREEKTLYRETNKNFFQLLNE